MQDWKHIIWDWNGTLFDDAKLSVECVNKLLRKYGKPLLTAERYEHVFGFPVIDYYRRIGFNFSMESWKKVAADFIDEYESRRLECDLQKDSVHVLQSCADKGCTQSILSAYKQEALNEMVAHFGLDRFFSRITGLNDNYAESKIEIGKQVIGELDLDKSSIVLVGDTVHDFEVSQAVGVSCVLIPCGHQCREKLQECGSMVVDSLKDFLNLF